MSAPAVPVVVNGSTLFSTLLLAEIEAPRWKDPDWYARRNAIRRLAAIQRLALGRYSRRPFATHLRRPHRRRSSCSGHGGGVPLGPFLLPVNASRIGVARRQFDSPGESS